MKQEEHGRNAVRQAGRRKRAGFPIRIIHAFRAKRWTAVWYGFLILAGMRLYKAGVVYSANWRGYHAVGGEALIPLLPVLCSGLAAMIRDILRDGNSGR